MQVMVYIPDNFNLTGAVREANLSMIMKRMEFRPMADLEKLGILTLIALKESGFYKEKIEKPKKRIKKQ